jgi:leucyl-tRNA synthetase
MSKSKGNVVSPDQFVDKYGSDVFRMYLMFMGPFTDGGDWNDSGIKGIDRFAKRVYSLFRQAISGKPATTKSATADEDGWVVGSGDSSLLHKTIKKVTDDMNKMQFNTSISSLMVLLNEFEKNGASKEAATAFVKLLSPLAPHLAEELWEMLHSSSPRPSAADGASGEVASRLDSLKGVSLEESKGFVSNSSWPTYDESLLVSDSFTLVVQINGKVRANIEVESGISEEDVIEKATADPNVQKFLGGSEIKKAIYIQGKIVSFVV